MIGAQPFRLLHFQTNSTTIHTPRHVQGHCCSVSVHFPCGPVPLLLVDSDSSGQHLTGIAERQVIISDDYGKTWTSTASTSIDLEAVVSGGVDGMTLLALPAEGRCSPLISFNRGLTWNISLFQDQETMPSNCEESISSCFEAVAAGDFFVVACHAISGGTSRIFTSKGGQIWSKAHSVEPFHSGRSLAIDKQTGQHIAVINGGQLDYSSNFGQTWSVRPAPEYRLVAITMDGTGQKLAAFYSPDLVRPSGVLVSNDAGLTWNEAVNPQPFSYQGSVASTSMGDRVFIASGLSEHLFVYDGLAVSPLPGSIVGVYLDFAVSSDGKHLIAAVNNAFYCSHDSGSTWELCYKLNVPVKM